MRVTSEALSPFMHRIAMSAPPSECVWASPSGTGSEEPQSGQVRPLLPRDPRRAASLPVREPFPAGHAASVYLAPAPGRYQQRVLRYRIVTGVLPSLYVRRLNYIYRQPKQVGKLLRTSQPTHVADPRRV